MIWERILYHACILCNNLVNKCYIAKYVYKFYVSKIYILILHVNSNFEEKKYWIKFQQFRQILKEVICIPRYSEKCHRDGKFLNFWVSSTDKFELSCHYISYWKLFFHCQIWTVKPLYKLLKAFLPLTDLNCQSIL